MSATIVINDVTYSIAAAAAHFGIRRHTLINRLKYGWTPNQAVGLEPRAVQHGKSIEIEGMVYDSIKDAALAYGLSITTVRSRLSAGFTERQALGLDPISTEKKYNKQWEVVVGGVRYGTLAEAARTLGKVYTTVVSRVEKNWTLDEAFDLTLRTPKHGYPGVVYKIEHIETGKCYIGVTMRSIEHRWEQHVRDASPNNRGGLSAAIAEYGPSAFTISILAHATNHMEMQSLEIKWIKQLNTLKPNGYNLNIGGSGSMPNINHQILVNGKVFPSIATAMRHLRIELPYQTVIDRLSFNWTPEQALGLEPHVDRQFNGWHHRNVSVNGIDYRSLAEACRQIPGAPEPTLAQNRLTNGWTPEEAFNVIPHNDQRGKRSIEHNVLNDKATLRSTTGYRGVSKHQMTGKYQAAFSHKGKRYFVGLFEDAESANDALQKARQAVA